MINLRKYKNYIFIFCTLVLVVFKGNMLLQKEEELSYETFDKTCEFVYMELLKEYNLVELPPAAMIYDGNKDNIWTEDTFTIFENNVATPKQSQYLIGGDYYITKIILSYVPYITDNHYIMVDRLRERDVNRLEDLNKEVFSPTWFMNSFTVNGIYIRVESVGVSNSGNSSEMEDYLVSYNGKLTSDIQQLLLQVKE